MTGSARRRIQHLHERLSQREALDYDLSDTISERDQALITLLEVYMEMKEAVAHRFGKPLPDDRGGTPLPPPRDYTLEILGEEYTTQQFRDLASRIALERRSYPPPAVAIFAPQLAEVFEEGVDDEYGEPMISFENDEVGATDE
jgi:hypothetical protein